MPSLQGTLVPPDRVGWHRPPYWRISEIYLTNISVVPGSVSSRLSEYRIGLQHKRMYSAHIQQSRWYLE